MSLDARIKIDMPATVSGSQLVEILAKPTDGARQLVAIAGPPGAGKSTFATWMVTALELAGREGVGLVPMDGFHLDDAILEARGWRSRKGAPHTFDVAGLKVALERLRAGGNHEVLVPVFDRALELSRAGARAIGPECTLVVVEGNYLLLDEAPWNELAPLFDVTVMLKTPMAELRKRLERRWRGLGLDGRARRAKLEQNDLPNAKLVRRCSANPDYFVEN